MADTDRIKVKVLADHHEDSGILYNKDDVFETDQGTADWMIANKVGEIVPADKG